LILGAKANHDASVEISQADTNEATASGKLSQIQATMQNMSFELGKIAGAANINPNQSADELAKSIIRKLTSMQGEIDQNGARVSTLEHPPPNPYKIYQDGQPVGDVIKGHYTDPDQNGILFEEIDNSGAIDFSKPIEFRGVEFTCQPTNMLFMFGSSPITGQPTQAVRQEVPCQRNP